VKEALNAFFLEQNDSGLWDKGRGDSLCDGFGAQLYPISNQKSIIIFIRSAHLQVFSKDREKCRECFCFSTDTFGSLLDALPAEYFRPHLSKEHTEIQSCVINPSRQLI
jgi:hypothetical protein